MTPSLRLMKCGHARTLALCLTAALAPAAVGCGAKTLDTSTDTGNPPVVDLGKLSSEVDGDTVIVTGRKGAALPGGSLVTVTNQRTGEKVSVKAKADGSFTLTIAGEPGDTLEVEIAGGEHTELLRVADTDAGTQPEGSDGGVPPLTTQLSTATPSVATELPSVTTTVPGAPSANPMATATTTDASTTPPLPEIPEQHRASRETCDAVRPASLPSPDGEASPSAGGAQFTCESGLSGMCCFDEDCTEGTRGRCDSRNYNYCTYDSCQEDGDCATGGPCACSEGGNKCLGGNCQIDSDCSGGALCSPTFGTCGLHSGVVAYYCHTPEDECTNDGECTEDTSGAGPGAGYCMFSPDAGHWLCSYSQCAG